MITQQVHQLQEASSGKSRLSRGGVDVQYETIFELAHWRSSAR
jgi:hypothetical protein